MEHIKQRVRHLARATVLRPPYIKHCSQTVYEALLGCCRMWEATGEDLWKKRSDTLSALLCGIQQEDGGFDIGYEFNFGRLHKKGQSTSPELVGLVALADYARLFGRESVQTAAHRAADWIRDHALDFEKGSFAIAYSPHTVNEVMVYNGTSFACAALGCHLGVFGDDAELQEIYEGMAQYMLDALTQDENTGGSYWYYYDQSRTDLATDIRHKVDYYHQMQQVEVHALAQQVRPLEFQLEIIRTAADYVCALETGRGYVEYCNDPAFFKGQIHLWGLASVVPGMLEAAVVVADRADDYRRVATRVSEWIIENAWNGEYFEPVLTAEGKRIPGQRYMVRSDAWVFNAMAAARKHLGEGPWNDVLETTYTRMEKANFSGPETHASRKSARTVLRMYNHLRRRAARWSTNIE